jgi:hypothetical protein
MKASRGNPGYFHGAPLDFLLKHLPLYLATPSQKKDADFWRIFNPEWDEQYPSLDSTELEELISEERPSGNKITWIGRRGGTRQSSCTFHPQAIDYANCTCVAWIERCLLD